MKGIRDVLGFWKQASWKDGTRFCRCFYDTKAWNCFMEWSLRMHRKEFMDMKKIPMRCYYTIGIEPGVTYNNLPSRM